MCDYNIVFIFVVFFEIDIFYKTLRLFDLNIF